MSILYIVVPLALVVVAATVGAFVWAASRGQFDDLDTPAVRMLHDDAPTVSCFSGHRIRNDPDRFGPRSPASLRNHEPISQADHAQTQLGRAVEDQGR
jgi:cbb3-type cytochrome oxidase maturation protein